MKKLGVIMAAAAGLCLATPASAAINLSGTGPGGSLGGVGIINENVTIAAPTGANISSLVVTLNNLATTNLQDLVIVLTHNAQLITLTPTSAATTTTAGSVEGTFTFTTGASNSLIAGSAPGTYKYLGTIGGAAGGDYTLSIADFVFNNSRTSLGSFQVQVTAVPEPMTWALLLVGFGLVGALARRRPSNTAALS